MKNNQVSISPGNAKMGAIPSVSLPACITCNPSAPCFAKCYAATLERIRKTVKNAYARNLDILRADPNAYWVQVQAAASMTRYFRYHVSGDIPDELYLNMMVCTAIKRPGTKFLAFTKQFPVVNAYLDKGGKIPENLVIIFSNWGKWRCDNPHGLPESNVIFKGESPRDDWKVCGGNCTECACRGVGCWELKNGETIAFYEH